MQLTFSNEHISITSLDADPLTKFAAITGLNGTGKTHLLKAIETGGIVIEEVSPKEVVYFNYGEFSVDPNYNAKQATNKGKHDQSSKKLQQLKALHGQRVTEIQQAVQPHLDSVEQILWGFLQDEKSYQEVMDVELWGDGISNNVSNLVEQLQMVDPPEVNITFEFVEGKWASLSQRIQDEFESRFPGYYDFVSGEDGSAAGVLRRNFERADFFAFDLANQVRDYVYQQYLNDHNELRATRRGEQIAFLTQEEFIELHGSPPIDLLNAVLEEFDCNGYRFETPDFYPTPGYNPQQAMVPLKLVHKTKGYQTKIENLSSGEQTLLALALAVYKARRGRWCRVLLLDEVDASLHPSMTKQMLRALIGVFVEQQGMNVIMATHSPSTIALAPDDSVFLLKKGDNITLRKSTKADAIEFLTEGFATLDGSLKLVSSLSEDKIYIFSEGDNVALFGKANRFFGDNRIEVIRGIESVSGDSQLKVLFDFYTRIEHPANVFFIWDCDVKYDLNSQNRTFPFIIPVNESNTKVQRGIENLFPESAFSPEFYEVKSKSDGGTHSSLNKRRFTKHMIENGTVDDFTNFKQIFEHIEATLNEASSTAEVTA